MKLINIENKNTIWSQQDIAQVFRRSFNWNAMYAKKKGFFSKESSSYWVLKDVFVKMWRRVTTWPETCTTNTQRTPPIACNWQIFSKLIKRILLFLREAKKEKKNWISLEYRVIRVDFLLLLCVCMIQRLGKIDRFTFICT